MDGGSRALGGVRVGGAGAEGVGGAERDDRRGREQGAFGRGQGGVAGGQRRLEPVAGGVQRAGAAGGAGADAVAVGTGVAGMTGS
ncbi:hypothetical protein SJI45_18560 [Streptomyces sp. S399]|uniref:hypothetical protein n=1 Tax=Streptomyces sp. S399 TaxID=3096009 RepID=UPI002A82C567|nr:hypothetical protein [Streptomyces sp. S399]WPR52744.1 hypothetical protein SJI45_18560 [Streptomyces sp. S399]